MRWIACLVLLGCGSEDLPPDPSTFLPEPEEEPEVVIPSQRVIDSPVVGSWSGERVFAEDAVQTVQFWFRDDGTYRMTADPSMGEEGAWSVQTPPVGDDEEVEEGLYIVELRDRVTCGPCPRARPDNRRPDSIERVKLRPGDNEMEFRGWELARNN